MDNAIARLRQLAAAQSREYFVGSQKTDVEISVTMRRSEHVEPDFGNDIRVENIQMKAGQWDKLLARVWPLGTKPVSWPPPLTFENSGKYSIACLFTRWRIGKNSTTYASREGRRYSLH